MIFANDEAIEDFYLRAVAALVKHDPTMTIPENVSVVLTNTGGNVQIKTGHKYGGLLWVWLSEDQAHSVLLGRMNFLDRNQILADWAAQ